MSILKFTTEPEWLRINADGSATIGITEYAQEQLGDIVYVELPEINRHVEARNNLVVIESVKAVGEVKFSVGGTIAEINPRLNDEPELVNQAPQTDGWLVRLVLDDPRVLEAMLDETAYRAFVASL